MLSYSMVSAFPMLGASVFIIWRHRMPIIVAAVTTGLTILLPTTPLPSLIALSALTYARKGWLRWLFIATAFAGTVISFGWDVATHDSFIADIFGAPAEGTSARLALLWVVPVLAALSVAPFAAFGIGRRLLSERDLARSDVAVARRTVTVLQREVDQEQERQELARELHDTLAADLSQVALHAGALELMVADSNPGALASARIVRESAQNSLDDLRQMVRSLRAHGRGQVPVNGLDDLPSLVDEALRSGTDVRAQIMVSDSETCSPRVSHVAYRIVQEAISNVRRHAPGAALHLEIRGGRRDGLTIRTANWLTTGVAPTSEGGGHGLQGMNERVQLIGGTFQAGITPEGSFAITVSLPWSTD
ncbi:MAG: sensor histidine kinase [Humibacter sp.]